MSNSNYTPEDITAGSAWGCEFRVRTWINTETGAIADPPDEPPTELSDVQPGEYSSWGVISIRDTESRLFEIQDAAAERSWVVPWDDCWNIDTVEFKEP